jgi:hypothetical protein
MVHGVARPDVGCADPVWQHRRAKYKGAAPSSAAPCWKARQKRVSDVKKNHERFIFKICFKFGLFSSNYPQIVAVFLSFWTMLTWCYQENIELYLRYFTKMFRNDVNRKVLTFVLNSELQKLIFCMGAEIMFYVQYTNASFFCLHAIQFIFEINPCCSTR